MPSFTAAHVLIRPALIKVSMNSFLCLTRHFYKGKQLAWLPVCLSGSVLQGKNLLIQEQKCAPLRSEEKDTALIKLKCMDYRLCSGIVINLAGGPFLLLSK